MWDILKSCAACEEYSGKPCRIFQNMYKGGANELAPPWPGRTKPADEGGREGGAIGEEASMPCYELFLAGDVAS